jgi:biotin transport system substrate-specific component
MQARGIDAYSKARYSAFKWRAELTIANKFVLAFSMAALTGILAQTRVYLPWTPVPITGQTFAALMAGILLGKNWGGISQAIYVVLGVAGIPWFAGASGSYTALIGPSGGYLIGFVFAALFVGHFTDKYVKARSFWALLLIMSFANFVLIYIPGLLQLGIWFKLTKGTMPTLWQLLSMGVIPFIPGCLIKIIAAATIAKGITPKEAFNGEADARK